MATSKPMSMKSAAETVLSAANGPLHSSEITKRALAEGLVQTSGKTPAATMAAQLAVDIRRNDSRFLRVSPGIYGLRARDHKQRKARTA